MVQSLKDENIMYYDLQTFWDSSNTKRQQERAHEMTQGLMALGHSQEYAKAMVEAFHRDAFTDGEHEEAFNSCGEDA